MRRLFIAVLACLGMLTEAAFALPQNTRSQLASLRLTNSAVTRMTAAETKTMAQ